MSKKKKGNKKNLVKVLRIEAETEALIRETRKLGELAETLGRLATPKPVRLKLKYERPLRVRLWRQHHYIGIKVYEWLCLACPGVDDVWHPVFFADHRNSPRPAYEIAIRHYEKDHGIYTPPSAFLDDDGRVQMFKDSRGWYGDRPEMNAGVTYNR